VLENIEKAVADWHQPAIIHFCHGRTQVDNLPIPLEALPGDAKYFAIGADAGQAAKRKPR